MDERSRECNSLDGASAVYHSAIIYTRISDRSGTRQSASLDVQFWACQRYAEARHWPVQRHYHDAMTGRRPDRPQYQAMLEEVRQMARCGQRVAVIVAALDRLGRQMLEGVRCRTELKELGATVYSVREGGELSDLVADILSAVAQEEARLTSARIQAAARHLAMNGWHNGANVPWGYRRRPRTSEERALGAPRSVLEIDPATGPYVTEMFRRAAAGARIPQLIRWLHSAVPEVQTTGLAFKHSTISRRLASPTYVARTLMGEPDVLRRPVGHWPPLVDDRTWRRVQQRLAEPPASRTAGNRLLVGYLRCAGCGRRAAYGAGRYTCSSRGVGVREHGRTPYVGAERPINAAVLATLNKVIAPCLTYDQAALARAWHHLRAASTSQKHAQAFRQREQRAKRARRRLSRAALLLTQGDLDATGYELVQEAVQAELESAEKEVRVRHQLPLPQKLPRSPELQQTLVEWRDALASNDIQRQRTVVDTLVASVRVQNPARAGLEVSVTWTLLGQALLDLAEGKGGAP